MQSTAITFTRPNVVELVRSEVSPDTPGADDVWVRTEASVLSAGTELAILRGTEWWAALPYVPGYGNIGRVIATGSAVTAWKPGDRVYSFANHASVTRAQGLIMRAPEDLDPTVAVLARMAQVAITSLRQSTVGLGDVVAVQGLGLVGNLAAQLFALSGATVIGVDVSAQRLELARRCGIRHVVNAKTTDPVKAVQELTGGAMCSTVVEASGVPDLVMTACKMAGKPAEVILLGSPRGQFSGNPVELLNMVHIWGGNNVTLKGAHEWSYPTADRQDGFTRHSIERNVRIIWELIRQQRLQVRELTSHILSPAAAPTAYAQLAARNDDYAGVVFDWSQLT